MRRPCKIGGVHAWSIGDHLTHRFNPELGTGRVTAIEGRVLVVHFPQSGSTLRLAANSDALRPATEPSRPDERDACSSGSQRATSTRPKTS